MQYMVTVKKRTHSFLKEKQISIKLSMETYISTFNCIYKSDNCKSAEPN